MEFSRQSLEKYSNTKFHQNPSSISRYVPFGQTDRHDEANSRYVAISLNVPEVSRNYTSHEKCKTTSDITKLDFAARKREWAER